MTWLDAGDADRPDGTIDEVLAGDLTIAVARAGDRWHAFETWCTHLECPLTDGWIEGSAVRCACHGALFELSTGVPVEGPAEDPIRLFPTRVTDGRVQVEVP